MTFDRWLHSVKTICDYAAGAGDEPPNDWRVAPTTWAWAMWWGALTLVIVLFCGQASKFIYIDF